VKLYQTVSIYLTVYAQLPLGISKQFDMGGRGLYKNLSRKSKYGHNQPKTACGLHEDLNTLCCCWQQTATKALWVQWYEEV